MQAVRPKATTAVPYTASSRHPHTWLVADSSAGVNPWTESEAACYFFPFNHSLGPHNIGCVRGEEEKTRPKKKTEYKKNAYLRGFGGRPQCPVSQPSASMATSPRDPILHNLPWGRKRTQKSVGGHQRRHAFWTLGKYQNNTTFARGHRV